MKRELRLKLNNTIKELTCFIEKDYSSHFKLLTPREDRQLFFLARILVDLKKIAKEVNEEEKIIAFPLLKAEEK